MRRPTSLLLLAAFALGGAACGDDGGDELLATTWQVTSFIEGDRTIELDPPNQQGFLRFEAEGFVGGHDGCNGFGFSGDGGFGQSDGLSYDIGGSSITLEGAALSNIAGCLDQEYEDRFRAVIVEGTVDYELEGDQLTVTAPDGRGIVFVGVPD